MLLMFHFHRQPAEEHHSLYTGSQNHQPVCVGGQITIYNNNSNYKQCNNNYFEPYTNTHAFPATKSYMILDAHSLGEVCFLSEDENPVQHELVVHSLEGSDQEGDTLPQLSSQITANRLLL